MFSRRFADETKVDDIQEKEADIGTYANKVANLFDEIDKEKMPTLATTQNIFMRHFNDQISNDGGETKIQCSKATMLHCAQAAFQDLKEELSESKKSLRRFKFSSTDSDIELQQKTLKTITNGSALKLKYESDEEVEF